LKPWVLNFYVDPALIRPGRIDRKIEFPNPDEKTKKKIFSIHTGRMNLSDDVNIGEFVNAKDDLSGADIKALCTEVFLMSLGGFTSFKREKNENYLRGFKIG
jgi:26S proteasome regulatory subunit T2